MWGPLAILLLVGAVVADYEHAWKSGNEYHYLVRSRTFTAIDELSDQYSGIVIKALLTVQAQDSQSLRAKVSKPQYAHVHKELSDGWETQISDQMLELRDLPMSGKPFEIKLKHGVIRDLITDRDVPTWEVNMLKAIVSQLQVDTQGENAIRSRSTQAPDDEQPFGMFKAMEDSVGGKCEVLYDITPLPEHMLQKRPELVPLPNLKKDGQLIDIIKTKNYSRCEQRVGYHFGIAEKNNWEPGANDNGKFLSKSTNSRIVISGNLKQFTIQSAVTTNKMFVSPKFQGERSGIVVSRMNLTLASVKEANNPLPSLSNPESTGNLVYTFDNPFSENEHRRPGRPNIAENSRASDSSSLSSVSSSEEGRRNGLLKKVSSSSSSGSSSSISSSEENNFWQPKPTLEEAPQNPLLPFFIGNKGKAIGMFNKIDTVKESKELVSEIANEVEDPSVMPPQQTLEKFTILTSLIRTMSWKQIQEVESNMHLSPNDLKSNDKSQIKKQNAWEVFRDAVTEAGTGPALLAIKNWIENRKVEGWQATEIVARIPNTAQTPTTQYVDTLFELMKHPEVKKQTGLNSTVTLSFAELVRKALVSNSTIHNRYPVHTFGRMSSKHNQVVQQVYIPFLARELKNAIKDGDSPRIQTYILALGNIAHPKILSVFEPYLEGKEQISTFQRTVMVAALSKLAQQQPRLARSVLYKIYLNTMDAHEVRCMAVYLIMKTNPPLVMLQRMAEFTQYDTSKHVNSAVKSALESIATLKRPETKDLTNKAQAAMNLLNSYQHDPQYSTAYVTDDTVDHLDMAYRLIVNYIGSDDSIIPRAWYLGFEASYGELKPPSNEIQGMISSIGGLVDMYTRRNNKEDSNAKSRTEKIAEILNIEPEDAVQVEGHLLWSTEFTTKFLAFDNHTIERIPEFVSRHMSSLKNGGHFNKNKLMTNEITLSFPTETGLPFVYSLKMPSLCKVSGNAKVQANLEGGNVKADVRVVEALKHQGRLGFIAPFEHQQFISGIDACAQVYVPFKVEAEVSIPKKTGELKLWPLKDEKHTRLIHLSQTPFTTKHDILNLRPLLTDKNTQRIHAKESETKTKTIPSEENEFIQVVMSSDVSKNGEKREGMKNQFPWSQDTESYQEINVFMNLQDVTKEPVLVRVTVDSMEAKDEPENSEEWTAMAMAIEATEKGPDSEQRRKQFLKEAMDGIKSGKAYVVDMRLDTPGGELRSRNAFTVAWANSNQNDRARALLFWQLNLPEADINTEVCGAAVAKTTPNPNMDFESAMRNKPKMDFDVDIRYGKTCMNGKQIEIKGRSRQTEQFKQQLRGLPIVKKCEEQMKQGNQALRACQHATDIAMIQDLMEISVDLQSETLQHFANEAIEMMENESPNARVNMVRPKNSGKSKIDLKLQMSENLESADISIHTPLMDLTFPKVDMSAITDTENMIMTADDADVSATPVEFDRGTCVLDKNQAETFDGRAFPLKLGKCWHVAMTTYPKENPDNPNESLRIPERMRVSVVTRETDDGKEVKVNLGEKQVRLSSSGSHLIATVNNKKIEVSKDNSHQERDENNKLEFEILQLPSGLLKLVSDKYDIEAVYDGKRIQLQASYRFENAVRGLCGNFDGESDNDFVSPQNCILRKPEEFLASYALLKDECQGPSLEIASKLEKSQCKRQSIRLTNVINDFEAGRVSSGRRNWGYHANEREGEKHCNTYRTKVMEVDDKVCFSIRPVPVCADRCRPVETKTKSYQFHCMKRNDASLEMKKRVEKGANPDLSQKTPSLTEAIQVPLECQA